MTHRKLRRLVSAYVDGETRGAQEREVSEHLNECWECRGAAQLLRLMKQSLRRLGRRSQRDSTSQDDFRAQHQ